MFHLLGSEQNIKVDQQILPLQLWFAMSLNSCPFLRHQLPVVPLARRSRMTVTCTFGVTVTTLAGQWALLLFAADTSFLPGEKSLLLEVILNHQSNEPLLKSGFSVTWCCHLTVVASNRVTYWCKFICWNLLNRMILCSVACRLPW